MQTLWNEKRREARKALQESLATLEQAMTSDIWGYTRERENELGRLSVARDIIAAQAKKFGLEDGEDV